MQLKGLIPDPTAPMRHSRVLKLVLLGFSCLLFPISTGFTQPAASIEPGFANLESTGGKNLKSPVALKPFSTTEISLAATDVRSGTGSHFVVDWAAAGEIAEPAVEGLMFGGHGSGYHAFISQGRQIELIGNN